MDVPAGRDGVAARGALPRAAADHRDRADHLADRAGVGGGLRGRRRHPHDALRRGRGELVGVEAVIDKDLASELLSENIDADLFVMATDVDGVYVGWGTPDQRRLDEVTPQELRALSFAAGSMGPKVDAAARFVEATGRRAAIGSLEDIEKIVAGTAGTNVVAPGKRTRHTINPALSVKDGKAYMAFGTPGADTQPQTELQFFLNVVDFGMNVQQALEQDAVISTGFRDSYQPHAIEGRLMVPASVPRAVQEGLVARGYRLDVQDVKGVGWVKAIIINPQTGVLMGGVSPKDDAYVMGW